MHILTLKPRKDRRLRRGHPWVFSNEIADWGPEAEAMRPGDLAEARDPKGRFLARGYVNRHSLIAFRVLGRSKKTMVDESLIADRVRAAVAARQELFGEGCDAARLVSGEGDQLPGLIVDRYADVLVIQLLTQGIERFRDTVLATLREVCAPRAMVERGDSRGRALEKLPTEKRVIEGALEGPVEIRQDGLRFLVDVLEGQKTGFFLDQRSLRKNLMGVAKGRKVLDVFCYTGATAAYAARAGALEVAGVDSSRPALEAAEKNFALNELAEAEWIQGDAFQVLQKLAEEGRQFGVVLLDPPPFAPSRKDKDEALVAHTRLHKLALRVLEDGGHLISSSCSYHMGADDLGESAAQAGVQSHRHLRLLKVGGAFVDHPGVPGMPEARYLNTLYMQA